MFDSSGVALQDISLGRNAEGRRQKGSGMSTQAVLHQWLPSLIACPSNVPARQVGVLQR